MEVHLKSVLFGLLVLAKFSVLRCESNHIDEESNPFIEAARSLLQDSLQKKDGPGIGGILQSIMQTDGGKQIGDMLLQQTAKNPDLLSNIGSLVSNIGSTLGDASNSAGGGGGGGNSGGFDPALIGQMMDMFSGKSNDIGNDVDPKQDAGGIQWDSLMSVASTFMAQANSQGGQSSGMEGIMNLLPVLMNSIGGGHIHYEDKELEDVEEHKRHEQASSFLPPFLGILREYWEHFKQSELGQTLWNNSGLGRIFQLFVDKDGHFQVDRIFDSMENHAFRRRWIKSLTSFVAEWIKHVSEPATQKRYLATLQFIGNGFLKSQGYARAAMFDPARPAESLSFLADAVFKRQFGLKVNSAKYIRPAVAYVQDVFRLGQSKGLSLSHLTQQEIENKLAETLNGEVIEPVLRVWRAYRYAIKNPSCDRYLICAINRVEPGSEGFAGLKPGVTKITSLMASWFLSGRTGTPFWKFYNAATEDHNCQARYPAECKGFHEEDVRATTEYAHSEL
ncbi:unnamed protein product [Bemisia tabaci]|uniref:Uncharacterized protein n=1 Tax=Bemisia tabaci TaxID=7038 RepID=A0A9P0F3S6_BEMTA|nr:unnamed protein product [Bemisia tabaci]